MQFTTVYVVNFAVSTLCDFCFTKNSPVVNFAKTLSFAVKHIHVN